MISSTITGPHGQDFGNSFFRSDVPAACQNIALGKQGATPDCLTAQGFHLLVSYQPAGRFWAFQGIESAIFVTLGSALIALAYKLVLSKDA